MVQNRFLRLIECLVRHDVRFVVVGGVAAVLQRVTVAGFVVSVLTLPKLIEIKR